MDPSTFDNLSPKLRTGWICLSSVRLDLSMVFARDVQGKKRTPQIGDVCAASSAGTCASLASETRTSTCRFIGFIGGQEGIIAAHGYAKKASHCFFALISRMVSHALAIKLNSGRISTPECHQGSSAGQNQKGKGAVGLMQEILLKRQVFKGIFRPRFCL